MSFNSFALLSEDNETSGLKKVPKEKKEPKKKTTNTTTTTTTTTTNTTTVEKQTKKTTTQPLIDKEGFVTQTKKPYERRTRGRGNEKTSNLGSQNSNRKPYNKNTSNNSNDVNTYEKEKDGKEKKFHSNQYSRSSRGRYKDHHLSGTGVGKELKKHGAGKGNWGKEGEELEEVTKKEENEEEKKEDVVVENKEGEEKKEGEENKESVWGTNTKKKKKKVQPFELRLDTDFKDLDDRWTKQLEFPQNATTKALFYITIYPDDGIWKGVGHKFEVAIPTEYPIEPPKVTCKTKVYHPNIDKNGAVCLNILRKDWRPILPLNAVFTGLHLLFLEPNPDDPLDLEAAAVFEKDYKKFERTAKNYIKGNYNDY